MNSEKNWMSDNLYERIKNPAVDYNIKLNIQKFKYLCFHEAAEQVALKIANLYDKIYIGYSGGIDSEYVVSCFHRLKIPFKAIITKCSGGEEESEYAINFCKRKNIILEHLICKDSDLLEIFYNDIYKKLNGIGTETMPIIFASKYAKNNPHKILMSVMKRNAKKLQATPKWVDETKIAYLYSVAAMLNKHGTEKYHVDHIVPLRGKNVSGLHVQNNLQILMNS